MRYKLKTLQIRTVAERSQIHSQYMQTARGVREKKLEEVGEQWYQIQRDRRNWNGSVPGKSRFDHETTHGKVHKIIECFADGSRRLHLQVPDAAVAPAHTPSGVQSRSLDSLWSGQACRVPGCPNDRRCAAI